MENQQDTVVKVRQINATKITLGVGMIAVSCVGVAFGIFLLTLASKDTTTVTQPAVLPTIQEEANQEALVIVSETAYEDIDSVKNIIEREGGMIRRVYDAGAFIAQIPYSAVPKLEAYEEIAGISFGIVATMTTRLPDSRLSNVIKEWNLGIQQSEMPQHAVRKSIGSVDLRGNPQTEAAVVDELENYLVSNTDFIGGIKAGEMKHTYIVTIPGEVNKPSTVFVDFIQMHDGLDVVGSYVHFAIKQWKDKSTVVYASAQVYPDLDLPKAVERDDISIQRAAATSLNLEASRLIPKGSEEIIKYMDGRWRKLQKVQYEEAVETVFVDKHTGAARVRDKRLYATIQGSVHGRGVLFDPLVTLDDLTNFELDDLTVSTTSGSEQFTNDDGSFIFPTETSPTNVQAQLFGQWAAVYSLSGAENIEFDESADPGVSIDLPFNPDGNNESLTSQVNAYYHTTYIHDWAQEHLPVPLTGIDIPLRALVNRTSGCCSTLCNAYFAYNDDDQEIGFYRAGYDQWLGQSCIYSAYDTILYHEYGHFIDHMAGGIPDTNAGIGLSEGWADIFATYATDQPIIGEGFFGEDTYIRTAENDYQYPQGGVDEVHRLGQAWVGFAWQLRQMLGVDIAESLVMSTVLANSPNIPYALFDLIVLDDDDGIIINGTPHFAEIQAAAEVNGLYPFPVTEVAEITSPALYTYLYPQELLLDTITITGTAHAATVGFPQTSYQLLYSETGKDDWVAIGGLVTTPVIDGILGEWNILNVPIGDYTIRLSVNSAIGGFVYDTPIQLASRGPAKLTHGYGYTVDGDWEHNIKPDISGSRAVWARYNYDDTYIDTFDFDNPQEGIQSIALSADWYVTNLSISGDNVVWTTAGFIYYYNLSNPGAGVQQIADSNLYELDVLEISGDNIIWSETGLWEVYFIYHYDLSNPAAGVQQLPGTEAERHLLDIDEGKIVWVDWGDENPYIYMFDLSNPAAGKQLIAESDGAFARISGNTIIWKNYNKLYLYDLSNPTAGQQLIYSIPEGHIEALDIDGSKIILLKASYFNDDNPLYLYDLDNTAAGLTELMSGSSDPYISLGYMAISENRIVWNAYGVNGNDNDDIYFYHDWDCSDNEVCLNYLDDDCDGWIDYRDPDLQSVVTSCTDLAGYHSQTCNAGNVQGYQCGTSGCEPAELWTCAIGCAGSNCVCYDSDNWCDGGDCGGFNPTEFGKCYDKDEYNEITCVNSTQYMEYYCSDQYHPGWDECVGVPLQCMGSCASGQCEAPTPQPDDPECSNYNPRKPDPACAGTDPAGGMD
ncbi:MAG: hypothetical protein ACNFW9_04935 [Candidatus Kerfeldbacteria bacterium]